MAHSQAQKRIASGYQGNVLQRKVYIDDDNTIPALKGEKLGSQQELDQLLAE